MDDGHASGSEGVHSGVTEVLFDLGVQEVLGALQN
jgi:hypothetical protein